MATQSINTQSEAFRFVMRNPSAGRAELCRRSLFTFVQEFWDIVSNTPFQSNWHIEYICGEVQKVFERVGLGLPREHDLLINVPPGTTKTIIVSIMAPAWAWTRWPWMQFICSSYGNTLSLKNANFCRDIVRSDKYHEMFPDLRLKDDDNNKSNFYITYTEEDEDGRLRRKTGGNRFSTSVGGAVTGFHAHVILIDDPLKPDEAISEQKLENANHHCEQTLSTRKVSNTISVTVLIMQRLHRKDPAGRMLERKRTPVFHICLPGDINDKGYAKLVRPIEKINDYIGGLLDPVRLDDDTLEKKMEELGQYGYAGQIGQNPSPPEGGMFKVDMFGYITHFDPMNIISSVRYWDKAGTKAKIRGGKEVSKGARTSGVLMHKMNNKRYIVENVKKGRWDTHTREDIIKATADSDTAEVVVYVEQEPGSGGKQSAEETIENLDGFVVLADRPKGDKGYRADPWSVRVNNGLVDLVVGDWNTAYVEEHRFFDPNGPGLKDQVDASSGAYGMLNQMKEVQSLRTRLHRRH